MDWEGGGVVWGEERLGVGGLGQEDHAFKGYFGGVAA